MNTHIPQYKTQSVYDKCTLVFVMTTSDLIKVSLTLAFCLFSFCPVTFYHRRVSLLSVRLRWRLVIRFQKT